MTPWIEDILDQLSTAYILAHAGISCGERLALIIVDNAVEYMCIVYVEAHKRLVRKKVIKRGEWEKKKRAFPDILEFVADQEPRLQPHVNTVSGFHDLRNKLYHGGQLFTVKANVVDKYLEIAREILQILLGVCENTKAQEKRTTSIHTALLGEAKKEIKAGVVFEKVNNVIRFSTQINVKLPDAICLILYGFATVMGEPPEFNQLQESLAYSGQTPTPQTILSRLSDLRNKRFVRRGQYALTASGTSYLQKKYLTNL